jgi:hypothetical protein
VPVVLELPSHSLIIFDLQNGVFSRFKPLNGSSSCFLLKMEAKAPETHTEVTKVFKDFRKEAASWKSGGTDKFYISFVLLTWNIAQFRDVWRESCRLPGRGEQRSPIANLQTSRTRARTIGCGSAAL